MERAEGAFFLWPYPTTGHHLFSETGALSLWLWHFGKSGIE
tara:strand:- start:848 stop:970 length:123 start_codon:yes stop_codon:yes gene_type:complete